MSERFGRTGRWARARSENRSHAATRLTFALAACLFVIAPLGCGNVSVQECLIRNAIDDRLERWEATNHLSGATGGLLARHELVTIAANDPGAAAGILERRLQAAPEPDGAFALAELSYQAGLLHRPKSPQSALAWYRDAAVLASLALAEPDCSRPDLALRDPQRSRGAADQGLPGPGQAGPAVTGGRCSLTRESCSSSATPLS